MKMQNCLNLTHAEMDALNTNLSEIGRYLSAIIFFLDGKPHFKDLSIGKVFI